MIGSVTPAWLVTMWYPPHRSMESSPPLLAGLALLGLVNAWMLGQVVRRPAPGSPLGRTAAWLRVLLYAEVLWLLIPSFMPDPVELAIGWALCLPWLVLFAVVITGYGLPYRIVMVVLGLVALMPAPDRAVGLALAAAGFVATVMQLLAQRRDGRWSRATVLYGFGTFGSAFLVELVDALTRGGAIESIAEAMDVLYFVWLARTARELNRVPAQEAIPLRVPRAVVATATLLPLLAVGAEERPRLSYTWQSGCDWGPPPRVAETAVHRRQRAYLCSVSKPDRPISDQALLSRGRGACSRFGAGVPTAARPELLVLLCPEVIGRRHPDLLLSVAQLQQRERQQREKLRAEAREEDARCRDPLPGLRTRVQATASYYDWDGQPYSVFDPDAADVPEVESTGTLAARGGLAVISTASQDWATCVTAKALRSAPPPLRRTGWDKVVEADIVSTSGRLAMQRLSASGVRFGNLARNGPGRYRLRLYTRDEVDLILIYPVSSRAGSFGRRTARLLATSAGVSAR
ncbi:MAG: hypothetical protein HOY71_54955 [Nonomuraea sp.]|nr:hypothetical protein [Nonomuraea sp.]